MKVGDVIIVNNVRGSDSAVYAEITNLNPLEYEIVGSVLTINNQSGGIA